MHGVLYAKSKHNRTLGHASCLLLLKILSCILNHLQGWAAEVAVVEVRYPVILEYPTRERSFVTSMHPHAPRGTLHPAVTCVPCLTLNLSRSLI